jgi:hypothetical protein
MMGKRRNIVNDQGGDQSSNLVEVLAMLDATT